MFLYSNSFVYVYTPYYINLSVYNYDNVVYFYIICQKKKKENIKKLIKFFFYLNIKKKI